MQIRTQIYNAKIQTLDSQVEITNYESQIEMTSHEAAIMYSVNDKMIELLLRAVNNRTRERNYFRKYCELLENEITDEEFDRELEENADEYAICTNYKADKRDLYLAMNISPRIKDISSMEDLSDLFSFERESLIKLIPQK